MVFARTLAIAAAALAFQAGASPLPQSASAGGILPATAIIAPPGLPNATYVAVGTGTAGDVTLVAARVATISSKATTVYDGVNIGPTNVAAIEFADNGAILQGFNCVRQGTAGGVICSGALVNPSTTAGYYFSGNGSTQVVQPTGVEALNSGVFTILNSLQAGASVFSAAAQTITSGVTVTRLPGFVGQAAANATAAIASGSTPSAVATSAPASRL